jgi:hypothetical protein
MKRAIRTLILTVGIVGTFVVAAVQLVPAEDGGPIITCPQRTLQCGFPPR